MIFNELLRDIPNEEYHGGEGYSSSQLKDMLEDELVFHMKYITKELARQEMPAFDIGTYFHTAILEPHLLEKECCVFSGIRRGKKWESFKEENAGKAIITTSELRKAETLIEATKKSKVAMKLVERAEPEVSVYLKVNVFAGEVFFEDKILEHTGWEKCSLEIARRAEKEGLPLIIKCRADSLGDGYISDLKSTTGNARSDKLIQKKISNYTYDLSASMYLDVFSAATGNQFKDFYWVFASKDFANCQTYLASEEMIYIGRQKWKTALVKLAYYISNNWTFEDEVRILEPAFYEKQWIKGVDEL